MNYYNANIPAPKINKAKTSDNYNLFCPYLNRKLIITIKQAYNLAENIIIYKKSVK